MESLLSYQQRVVPDLQMLTSPSPRCELCSNKPLFFCPADQAFLCRACDDRVHSANFIVLRHVRSALCQVCLSETGMGVQGARHRLQCIDVRNDPACSHISPVPGQDARQAFVCSPCSATLQAFHGKRKQLAFASHFNLVAPGNFPGVPLQHVLSASVGNSCTTGLETTPAAAPRHQEQDLKRRKGPSGCKVPVVPSHPFAKAGTLRLGPGYVEASPEARPRLTQLHHIADQMQRRDQWLRLAVEPDLGAGNGGRDEIDYSDAVGTAGSSPASTCCLSGPSGAGFGVAKPDCSLGQVEEAYRESQHRTSLYEARYNTPRIAASRRSSSSSVGSCSDTSTWERGVPKGKPLSCDEGRKNGGLDLGSARQVVPQVEMEKVAESSQPESMPANSDQGPAPLGRSASSRLKRVLKSWSVSLGGVNAGTQTLAYELFQRSLVRMKRGEVVANVLRVTLASCLWLATKLVELRAQVPGAKEVASVTAVKPEDLKKAELTVMKLLDWQPLKHVSEQVKAEAGLA